MTETNLQKINQYRSTLWQSALNLAFPAALWRLPNQKEKHFLVSFTEKPPQTKIDFEDLGAGFAFSPFMNPNGQASYFLPADFHLIFDENEEVQELVVPSEYKIHYKNFLAEVEKAFLSKTVSQLPKKHQPKPNNATEKERFIHLVNKGIQAIEAGNFQKVVPSRTQILSLSSDFEAIEAFDKACQWYPNAFVSMVSLPHLGVIWLGASPEILVSQDSKGLFRTMALAGTQSAYNNEGKLIKTAEALWRQKEIEEQALVSRYIINCFKKIRVREFEEIGPKTIIAGNLMHLRTEFLVDTHEVNFPQLATVMLDLLHPTSAVCGMPKEPATQFILANENYDREFYSGFLGPVNIKQESHIFVNLRTMKIQNEVATLYAGCGITADSDAEKEWLETEMKCQTLGKIFE
jgi:isochorismate synthase